MTRIDPGHSNSLTYREALRRAKEAVIAAIGALGDAGVISSRDEPRFGRLAEIASELRDMERDAEAVEQEHDATRAEAC